MKNFWKLFGIIVFIAVIGFTMTACKEKDNDDDDDNIDDSVVTVSQLPDFPSGSNPAMTEEAVQAVLAELRASKILNTLEDEFGEVLEVNASELDGDNVNFSFSDKSLPGGFVRVSVPNYTVTTTRTGGFITLNENWEGKDDIYFAVGDKENSAWNINYKGEIIKAKTEKGVTVAQGSTINDLKYSGSYSATVTEAGLYNDFKKNLTESIKSQLIYGLTVTTSSGSIKIIYDQIYDYSITANNVKHVWDADEEDKYIETEKKSGSLKVYGNNNTLLIDFPITDQESENEAYEMIHGSYSEPEMSLKNNVKVNKNINTPKKAVEALRLNSR